MVQAAAVMTALAADLLLPRLRAANLREAGHFGKADQAV